MIFEQHADKPFLLEISFHKVIEALESIASSDVDYRAQYAKGLLHEVAKVPELRTGITNLDIIRKHHELIRNLLSDLFPTALTNNEIKAVTIPFLNISFNYTQRFQELLNNAGPEFDMEIRDWDEHKFYVFSCVMLLNFHFGYRFDFSKPMFYDIPDAEGFMRHYRILYNGDFLEIFPTEKSIELTEEDVNLLMDNYNDLALWKAKIPSGSWILRGFGIMTLFDATTESAVSNLKTNLINNGAKPKKELRAELEGIFASIFRMNDLEVGFTSFDTETNMLAVSPFEGVPSFLLSETREADCADFSCESTFNDMMANSSYLPVSDIETYLLKYPQSTIGTHLLKNGIQSAIFAPVSNMEGNVIGIVELVSRKKRALNSINAVKLDVVMPYISDAINRFISDIQNQIGALIQREYTTIHPSVYWKFRNEAYLHLHDHEALHEIVFDDVYPLYGQIDIKGSSEMRNRTTHEDLVRQTDVLAHLVKALYDVKPLPVYEQKLFELNQAVADLDSGTRTDSEQYIQRYIRQEIHPMLGKTDGIPSALSNDIAAYFASIDPATGSFYQARRKFDTTVSIVNRRMATLLDKRQAEAQAFYPHYYERFKTDGVEHNLYIGKSITNQPDFDLTYLYNLRLWQLQVMCEMEIRYAAFKETLPYPMEVSSLILVFSQPLTIRFRMDEKRFDVDGSYNARYEIVKKRIDKANVLGKNERITQPGKITIVFAGRTEELAYEKYIRFLQHKRLLSEKIERFTVEDLQGVSGLRAIRVGVMLSEKPERLYSYEELLQEVGN